MSRGGVGDFLAGKIREALESAEKEIVRKAVEALLERGAVIETDNLEVDVRDLNGNPLLKVSFKGQVNLTVSKQS